MKHLPTVQIEIVVPIDIVTSLTKTLSDLDVPAKVVTSFTRNVLKFCVMSFTCKPEVFSKAYSKAYKPSNIPDRIPEED